MQLKGRLVKIPTTGRIKIRGDMYGPLNTPHFESLDDIKLMLTYGVEVIGFKELGNSEEKLTLENYANENIITIGNCCKHDPTGQRPVATTLPVFGQTEIYANTQEEVKEEEVTTDTEVANARMVQPNVAAPSENQLREEPVKEQSQPRVNQQQQKPKKQK